MGKLSEICTINMGQSPESTTYNENGEGLPFFQGNADFGKIHPNVRVWCNAPKKIAHKNDILISVRAPIGALNIADSDCCIGRGLASLSVNNSVSVAEYIWYALESKVDYLISMGTGSTFKAIGKNILFDLDIPLPPLEIQSKIAANLDKVTHTIDLCNAILEKLDLLVKSRFVEMFGDDFPKFDTIPLKDCCAEITGGGTPSMKHPEYYGGDIPFIKSGDVKDDRVSKGVLTLTDTALRETTAKLLPKDTVIVVVRSAALLHEFHIAVSDNPIVINQDLKAIKPTNQFMPIYLMWAVKMKERIILGKVQTMLTSHIRMDDFLYLDVPVPPLALQQQFATFVEQTDKSKFCGQTGDKKG